MRKIHTALLAGCLCCTLLPAFAKDAGWQWYNEKLKAREAEKPPVPAAPPPQMDILQKQALLQQATKKALAEAIMYPSVPAFVKYFRLQNYWTQQAGLFSMSAKKAMLAHPELDYNLQYSHYNGTVKNQLAADYAEQRRAISRRFCMGAGSSARKGLVSRFSTSTGGGAGMLLVPSYHKSLTPPHGVVVQPRRRGKTSFPRPRRFSKTVKEIL